MKTESSMLCFMVFRCSMLSNVLPAQPVKSLLTGSDMEHWSHRAGLVLGSPIRMGELVRLGESQREPDRDTQGERDRQCPLLETLWKCSQIIQTLVNHHFYLKKRYFRG